MDMLILRQNQRLQVYHQIHHTGVIEQPQSDNASRPQDRQLSTVSYTPTVNFVSINFLSARGICSLIPFQMVLTPRLVMYIHV